MAPWVNTRLISKRPQVRIGHAYVDQATNGYRQTYTWIIGANEWLGATKLGLDILQSCSVLASHRVKDIELESVIAV